MDLVGGTGWVGGERGGGRKGFGGGDEMGGAQRPRGSSNPSTPRQPTSPAAPAARARNTATAASTANALLPPDVAGAECESWPLMGIAEATTESHSTTSMGSASPEACGRLPGPCQCFC